MGKDLTIKQKKDWAKVLYTKERLTQAEIAERTSVSRVTVNKWINAERWEELRTSITITREEQLKSLYRQLAALNDTINSRNEGERFPTASEADTISKMAGAIKKMETDVGLSDIISVFSDLISWLRQHDLTEAKRLTAVLDAYVKHKLD